ncbi:hypothetical protein PFICI_03805 [Pestalotiopsis fici W106-1]|uniref:WSC domain-containing protein n=1 Tax=Pestalotiopsis fici (strain W106-1 / CGMCC3.15140) TaxID=1229662 RepID=W3XID9_PESFW|nr:uncharacterized protein PFICI_03805 [Pestalotiopsis fici W106-1]ETS85780.1 hypothetical protein PFICI_03805 [Pestalotiopsis fici W106-1]
MATGFRSFAVILTALSCLPRGLAWYRELPTCLDEFQPFVPVGCFDNGEPGGQEALSMKTEISVTGMTTEICVAECKGNGFRYAGLAWYGNCYCGQTVDTAMVDSSQCSLPCDGNKTQACGGDTQVNIYQDPTFLPVNETTVDEYVALGCYTDGSSLGKALFYQQKMADTADVTTEACLGACLKGGFPFAGTEYAQECYCGVVLGNDTAQVDVAECAMPCTGNSSQICGGPDRLSLYVAKDLQSLEPCGYEPPANSSSTTTIISSTTSSSLVSSSTSTPASANATYSYSHVPSSSLSVPTSLFPTRSATLTTSVSSGVPSSAPSSAPSSVPSSKPSTTTTSTTSSAAICTATTITPPTCEYSCGKWCSSPLPDWSDGTGCLTAWSSCSLQVAACFAKAGWPDAMDCFSFLEWCADISTYCASKGGSKSDCFAKNPPKGGKPSTTSTSVYPCPTTTTSSVRSSSSTTTTTSSYPVPTPTGGCKQPTNSKYSYGDGAPVGGIALPVMTCNNLQSDYQSGNVFKLYTDSDSRKCASYPRSRCEAACSDACRAQYDDCQYTYAEGCRVNGSAGGKSYGGSVDRFTETYESASTRCTYQYLDCLDVNHGITGDGKCTKYGGGW